MKKTLALVLALLMFASLAACGGGATPTPTPATTAPTPTPATDAPAATDTATPSAAPVTLTYVDWNTQDFHDQMKAALAQALPNITLQDQIIGGSDYSAQLNTMIAAGNAPDVFVCQLADYLNFARNGYLMDVSNQPSIATMAKVPAVQQAFTVNGKVYGYMMNSGGGPCPIFYNKAFFDANGLTVPTTMDEFNQLCEKIKSLGVMPMVFGGKDAWTLQQLFGSMAWSSAFAANPQMNEAIANGTAKPSDYYTEVFNQEADWVAKGYIGKDCLTMDYGQSQQYFADGKAAMMPQGPWLTKETIITTAEQDASKFQLAAFALPIDPINGVVHDVGSPDKIICVSATTKHPEEALQFFDFFSSPEFNKTFLKLDGSTTILPITYDINPIVQPFYAWLSSSAVQLTFAQTYSAPAFDPTYLQNILAGSPASTELASFDSTIATMQNQFIKN